MTRHLTSEAYRLRLKELNKRHQLNTFLEYHNQILQWQVYGQGYFEVTYDLCLGEEPFYLLLRYARQGRKVELKIPMEATRPHLGGERFWFRCPVTGKRCTVLYLPWGACYFASREAYCMAYPSQNKSHLERSWDKRLGDLIPKR